MFKTSKMWKSEIEKIMRHDDTFIGCYPHDRLQNLMEDITVLL